DSSVVQHVHAFCGARENSGKTCMLFLRQMKLDALSILQHLMRSLWTFVVHTPPGHLPQLKDQTSSHTAGCRLSQQRCRSMPALWPSTSCASPPITAVSVSVAPRTAKSTSSTRGRRSGGNGAACRTAAMAKSKGGGEPTKNECKLQAECMGRGTQQRHRRQQAS